MDIERRAAAIAAIEVRAGDGALPALVGIAAPFDSPAALPGFTEVIRRGAFAKSLQSDDDALALVEHDVKAIIGRRSAKTLTLSESERGLEFRIQPPDTAAGRDAVTLVRGGYLKGCSFAFRVDGEDGESWSVRNGNMTRELRSLSLVEVSLVAMPAYQHGTDVSVATRHMAALARAHPWRLAALNNFLATV